MKTSAQKLTTYTAVVLIVALVAVIAYLQLRPDSRAAPVASGALELSGQPSTGDENAPVKVAMFEDFKCPVCQNFDENHFPRLKREFAETGQAEFFFINFPFIGPDSTTAALAGECAYHQNEAAFWDFKTYVFRSQGPESQTWATPERLADIARTYVPALDADALQSCIEDETYADAVASDRSMVDALGVTGTPTLFVNGQKLPSFDYNTVKAAILAAAEAGPGPAAD